MTNQEGTIKKEYRSRPHICPVCEQYTFYDWYSYDDCPNCGIEDGFSAEELIDPSALLSPNWVTLKEGKWIWRHFHCDVNTYAIAHKKQKADPLPME